MDRSRQEEALEIFESIALSEKVDPPEYGTFGLRARNDKTLATVPVNRSFQEREDDNWRQVGQYAEKLMQNIKPRANDDSVLVLAA